MPDQIIEHKMRLDDLPLQEILETKSPFIVPKYQRDYAWDEPEIIDFILDLTNLYKSITEEMMTEEPPMRHFFGGLVCVDDYYPGTTNRLCYLIDGQQRLATTTITLKIIEESLKILIEKSDNEDFKRKTQKIRNKILKHYIFIYPDDSEESDGEENSEPVARLTLSKSDAGFFKQLINGEELHPTRTSHERLITAKSILKTELFDKILNLENSSNEEKLVAFKKYLRCILADLYVIHIISKDKNQAYKIFNTLNNRGKSLTDGDLLRSNTLELVERHSQYQDKIESYWVDILSYERDDVDDFLRSYYTSYSGERPSKYRLANTFMNFFFPRQGPTLTVTQVRQIKTTIKKICSESKSFHDYLSQGIWPYENDTLSEQKKERLYRLVKVLDHTLCMPLLLSAKANLEEDQFSKIVELLEKFVFRYKTICNGRIQKLAEIYYKYAKKVRENPSTFNIAEMKNELKLLIDQNADDDDFKAKLSKMSYKKGATKKNKQILHFLTTLEDYHEWIRLGAIGEPRVITEIKWDLAKIDIEHIYPQNAEVEIISDFEENDVKNNIGNLTFISQGENRSENILGNRPFSQKRVSYSTSRVKITQQISTLTEWNVEKFKERKGELINNALKIYNFNID